MSTSKPSADTSQRRCSRPIVVPATRSSSPFVAHGDADEVREVTRAAALLLGHVDAELLGDDRGVDVVDQPVHAALERAVQRRDRQQPRVVGGERRRSR